MENTQEEPQKVEEVTQTPPQEEAEGDIDNASQETDDPTDEQLVESAEKVKAEGNEFFKKGEYMEALAKYREASMTLEDIQDDSSEDIKTLKVKTNLNIAVVLNKLEKWSDVVNSTSTVLSLDGSNYKGLYFRAVASRHLNDFETAVSDIKKVIKLHPKDKVLRKEFEKIKAEKKTFLSSQKGIFSQAFGSGLYGEKEDPKITNSFSSVPAYNPENQKTFFDVKIGDAEPEKIIFELFNDKTPLTAENFRCLCTGEKSTDEEKLHYKGNKFHRIINNFMAQGGDITAGNGTGGMSIYGRNFDDEQVWIPHSEKGLLSMANAGPNTNGSQFFITFVETPHLNEKHTVFGRVIKGWETVKKMEAVKTGASDVPDEPVEIVDCGEYTEAIEEGDLELTKE